MSHTPGPWTACRMVHEETGQSMTPEQIGEYVCNSVKKSALESGSDDFLFVSVEKPDGPADVCHVGNGPTSPANAKLIAAAPDLLVTLRDLCDAIPDETVVADPPLGSWIDLARAAIAKAEGHD